MKRLLIGYLNTNLCPLYCRGLKVGLGTRETRCLHARQIKSQSIIEIKANADSKITENGLDLPNLTL
jgi:hypothetical protein